MCPLCIGSAAMILTATGSAGGLTLIAAKVLGARPLKTAAKVVRATEQLRKATGHRRI